MAGLAGTYLLRDDYQGRAKLVVDEAADTLVGATFVGPEVAELVHAATVADGRQGDAGAALARGAVLPDRQRGLAAAAGDILQPAYGFGSCQPQPRSADPGAAAG